MNHSRACLAKSMFAVIENFRDADWSDDEFVKCSKSEVFSTAESYLADGLMGCICKVFDRNGAEITGVYQDRFTGEMAVITTEGIVYRDSGNHFECCNENHH